jgi:hypothetical protein
MQGHHTRWLVCGLLRAAVAALVKADASRLVCPAGLINKTCTILTVAEADPLDELRPHPAGA